MNNAYTAQSLAAQGRGPDSMLVHMAPREVAGLQALAMAHGGSLTINPETGLPEAGFLSSILPMVAGAALAATGIGAPMAALMVGGGMTLATGSLQKGLMAGLGAFGGAGLGAGLMGAGAGAAAEAGAAGMGITEAGLGELGINTALASGTPGAMAAGSTLADLAASSAAAPQAMSPGMQMFEGAKSAFGSKPGFNQFIQGVGGNKEAIKYGLAAFSPMLMAQQGNKIPTATQSPGMIRPYTNDRRPTGGFGTSTSPGASGPLDSSERRWFEGTLTPQTPYTAGSQDFAEGGSTSDAIRRALLQNNSGPEAAPNTTSPDFARAYRMGSMANNPQLSDLERGVLQMDGFLPPPPPRPSPNRPAPARPSPIQRLEDNPYYTMTGDSGDAFRYLMGQQTPPPTTPPPPPGPITTMPVTPPPTTAPAPTTGTGDPRFAGLPQYTRDPVTGRIVLTHMPTQEERNNAGIGDPNGVGGDGGGAGGDGGAGAGDGGAGDGGAGDGGAGDGGDGGGAGDGGAWAFGGRIGGYAAGGLGALGGYSDGGRLLRGPGDGVSDSIPAMIGRRQPARLADGEFVLPARIVSEIGNGSTEAGSRKLYAMMDRIQNARRKTTGKNKVAKDTKAEKYLPA